MTAIPFFTVEDIQLLARVGNNHYNATKQEDVDLKNILINGVWEKTKFWHNSVLNELKDYGYIGRCRKRWDNHGKSFKYYTWTQIFKEEDHDKEVYFTVGVDGHPDTYALVYKLDYTFTGNKLTYEQKELANKLIKTSQASWLTIESDELINYSWEMLIRKTVEFIIKFTPLYDECVEQIWNINSKRVARIAYNTNGWVMPSGRYGKSKFKGTHEEVYGYGHEEWLLDLERIYEGYHYAFLEPIRKQHQAYVNKTFDIFLYTVNSDTKERFFVGEIFDVEVISEDKASEINKHYQKNQWLREMEKQIVDSNANPEGFSNWENLSLFNIRFLPYNIKLNDNIDIPIISTNSIYNLNRYSFVHYKHEFSFEYDIREDNNEEPTDNYKFRPTSLVTNEETGNPKTKTYNRPPKSIEILYLHKSISDMLLIKLQDLFGKNNVGKEVSAGYGGNKIDMVVQQSDGDIFYEIKTYGSLKTSIREALGQLFEYSHWMNKNKAKELIIVTQDTGEIEKAREYFFNLRKLYNIPIYYQYFDIKKNTLSEKV